MSNKKATDAEIAKAANALYDHDTLRGHSVVEITRIAVTALDAAAADDEAPGGTR